MRHGLQRSGVVLVLACLLAAQDASTGILDKTAALGARGISGDIGWYVANIPFLDIPDAGIADIYYYRWKVFRSNLRLDAPSGLLVVAEGASYGVTICPVGHHLYEGRWLQDRSCLDQDIAFWLADDSRFYPTQYTGPRSYINWLADGVHAKYLVDGDRGKAVACLGGLTADYAAWERERYDAAKGLFVWTPNHEGMETSLPSWEEACAANPLAPDKGVILHEGAGYRPSANSYMFANARAIARIAALAGDAASAASWTRKADALKSKVVGELWDPASGFFVQRRRSDYGFVGGREAVGFFPWAFHLPDDGGTMIQQAWPQLMDGQGFSAAYGPTTLERRNPHFMRALDYTCLWNGPSWPFSTSVVLRAMANLLNDYSQGIVTRADYLTVLTRYAATQRDPDGTPMVRENHHPDRKAWIATGGDYNHSSYCDLVISGLLGLRPRADATLEVNPLVPPAWDWFLLEDVSYHDRLLTILWDRDGRRYGRGAGLRIFADGKQIHAQAAIGKLLLPLASGTPRRVVPPPPPEPNLARNPGGPGPAVSASFTCPQDRLEQAVDGITSYADAPRNRWTCFGSPAASDWMAVDFGGAKAVGGVRLAIYDDGGGVRAPAACNVQYWDGSAWHDCTQPVRTPAAPVGGAQHAIAFDPVSTSRIRVVFVHRDGARSGISELVVLPADGRKPAR